MRDLAAYYAYLPRLPSFAPAGGGPPRIVATARRCAVSRPAAPVTANSTDKAGAAWLEGQPAAYLRAQLKAFASGARRNDISEQMRNVARRMTPEEIDAASRFYADRP